MIGPDLLLITTEFDRWELRQQKVADRLDVLCLDSDGRLLVAELKRGEAVDTTELQALKYAAYCSTLTTAEVVEEYSRYQNVSHEDAREAVIGHAPALQDGEPGSVRIRLLAGRFGPAVTSVVLWLGELGLDIGCVELRARRLSETHAVLTTRQILPPPEAKDYLVRRRRRETLEDEKKEASGRRRNSVTVINEHGSVETGTEICLNLASFSDDHRSALTAEIGKDPRYGKATWTGRGSHNALRWELDEKNYSPSGLVWQMLEALGFSPSGIAGPGHWTLPSGKSLWEEALALSDAGQIGDPGAAADADGVALD